MHNIIILFMKNYLILSVILIALQSCTSQVNTHNNETALAKLVKRVDLSENESKEAKDYIIDNKIYVWDLWEPVAYKDSIDWSINPYKNNSWYLYFQSLRMVGFLAQDYQYSKDSINISKTNEIIRSWHNNYKKDFFPEEKIKLSKLVWNDHATANRVLNLTHAYFTFIDDAELRGIIRELLYHHGVWLADQKNYTQGNHAVMIDRALFQLSKLFSFPESSQWEELSMLRLKKIFEREVTSEGACTENSSGYHFYVLDLLKGSVEMFKSYGIDYSKDWDVMISNMKIFGSQMLKPNNTLPTIGDTYYSVYPVNIFKKYSDSTYLYNSSFTKRGKRSNYSDNVYEKSGYAFFKEKMNVADSSNYVNRTYLSFINTNLSPVHKHNDFLSFTLSSNNEDLIIDAGHVGYEKNDLTKYIRSTFAHSTLIINDTDFNFKEINPDQLTISDYEITDDYSYVQGKFTVNEFTIIQRSILFLGSNNILLYDKLIASEPLESFSQTFILGNSFSKMKRETDNELLLLFKKNNLMITQLNEKLNVDVELTKSDYKQNNFPGVRAMGYGKVEDGSVLKYSLSLDSKNQNNEVSFVTLLSIKNERFINNPYQVIDSIKDITIKKNDDIIFKLKK